LRKYFYFGTQYYGFGKSANPTNIVYKKYFVPISLCDNNRGLHFSVCTTSVVHTFLSGEKLMLGIFGFSANGRNNKKITAKIRSNAPLIDTDFSKLHSREDISLISVCKKFVQKQFGLKNTDGIAFYCNINKDGEIYGERDGKVVFFGTYNLGCGYVVGDFFGEKNVLSEPLVYTQSRKCQLLIWRLDNGYMGLWVVKDKNTSHIYKLIDRKIAYFKELKI